MVIFWSTDAGNEDERAEVAEGLGSIIVLFSRRMLFIAMRAVASGRDRCCA